jgi:hypothetical protein
MVSRQYNFAGPGEFMKTPVNPWVQLLSAQGETAATTLDLTSGDTFKAISLAVAQHSGNSAGQVFDITEAFGKSANGAILCFYSRADAANDTFDFDLYGIREAPNSDQSADTDAGNVAISAVMPIYITSSNACKVGTMPLGYDPDGEDYDATTLAVDTITGTDCWPTGVTVNDSGNNRLCTIHFDLMGCRYLYLNTFNAGGGGTEAANIGALITAW